MTDPQRRLSMAICLSLLAHTLPFLAEVFGVVQKPVRPAPLQAELRPPKVATAVPDLILPEPAATPAAAVRALPQPDAGNKPMRTATGWRSTLRQQLQQWYSDEAIRLGLQGEVVVFFILDEAGNVSAARIEQGSGYPVLDRDALAAVRKLRTLPADTPREMLLPLRFRLKD